jgi:hypothetical protein
MTLHRLYGPPPADLARALAAFEEQFTYPLGPGRRFRISHGDDYPRFFRAIGEAACFVAERDGRVSGTLGAALRRLRSPDGGERPAVYLGDLKVGPDARGGPVLWRLASAAVAWAAGRADAAFGVVMDGTAVTPERYTGRLAVPAFQRLGGVAVLRVPTADARDPADDSLTAPAERGEARYRALTAGRYACPGGDPAERSQVVPAWLVRPDGSACGRLEDTRRAKRLFADDGAEMRSAHLSAFAYGDVSAGAALVAAARRRAGRLGFPALFAAVADREADGLCTALGVPGVVRAPAAVYGTGLAAGALWNVNTAEI